MGQQTEFFKAISEGDEHLVRQLLSKNQSLSEAKNEAGISALMFSLYNQKTTIADLLTLENASLDIFEASALGNIETLNRLIAQDSNQVNAHSSDGFTPLHLACFFGRLGAAKLLIESKADTNACSQNGAKLKPINSAAACRDLETAYQLVNSLLNAGADISAKQNGGYTALHSAAANGNVELVRLLLQKGADRNVLAEDKKTPLQFAMERNRNEVVELLS